jgi:Bacterial Ig-like domain (group 3)
MTNPSQAFGKKRNRGYAPQLATLGCALLVILTGCGQMETASRTGSGAAADLSAKPRLGTQVPTVTLTMASTTFVSSQPSTATVQVSCASACGNVDFRIDGGEWGTVPLNSSGSFTTSGVPVVTVGTHTLQVFYQGNETFAAATSNTLTYTVTATGVTVPTVGLTLVSNTFAVTQPSTATVQVSCNSACGSVDFRIDGNEWATVPLGGGGSFTTAGLPVVSVGTHTLQAFYQGNASFAAASSSSVTYTVVPDGSTVPTVALSMSATTFTASQTPTATVQVSCNSACGNVDFKIDGNEWATVPLNSSGSFTGTGLPVVSVGNHTLQAFFLGNQTFAPAASNAVTYDVDIVPTVTLSMSATMFTASQPGTATVQVSCNSACGQVDFRVDGNEWATVPLSSSGGFMTSGVPFLTPGSHTLQAFYLGTSTFAPASSNVVTYTVVSQGTTTPTVMLTMSPTSFAASQPSSATVQVSCDSACGSVDFRIDGGEWATVALNSSGSFTTSGVPVVTTGSHTLQVNFEGSTSFSAASSNVVTYTVTGP